MPLIVSIVRGLMFRIWCFNQSVSLLRMADPRKHAGASLHSRFKSACSRQMYCMRQEPLRVVNVLSVVPITLNPMGHCGVPKYLIPSALPKNSIKCSVQWYHRPRMHLRHSHAVSPTLLLVLGLLVGEAFPSPVQC